MIRQWFKSGTPWIWLNAGAVSIALVAVFGLLFLIMVRGMSHFWPADVHAFHFANAEQSMTVIAEEIESETLPANTVPNIQQTEGDVTRYLVKTGNRDILGSDFKWIYDTDLQSRDLPEDIMVLERIEWGNFYGYLTAVYENGEPVESSQTLWSEFEQRLQRVSEIREQLLHLEKSEIGSINYQLERLRLEQKRLELDNELTDSALQEIEQQRQALDSEYQALLKQTSELYRQINRDSIRARVMDGSEVTIAMERSSRHGSPIR